MEKFERLILGTPLEHGRLKELQEKSVKKGLKGDEVFEFIYLDRRELSEKAEKLEKENKELVEALELYADNRNWGYVCDDELPDFQVFEDRNDSGEYKNLGGKRARQALAKIKKEGEG